MSALSGLLIGDEPNPCEGTSRTWIGWRLVVFRLRRALILVLGVDDVAFERGELLAQLASAMAAPPLGRPVAQSMAQGCRNIFGADGVSLTINNNSPDRLTLYASDVVSGRLEELQDVLTEGPCWDAYGSGSLVATDMGADASRAWPEFTDGAVREFGRFWLWCFPLRPADMTIGTISLYRTRAGGPLEDSPGREAAQFLADTVGAALTTQIAPEEVLEAPWPTRAKIHQATGMIAAQLRISPDDALALLRANAYALDVNLGAAADQVLNRTLSFERTTP